MGEDQVERLRRFAPHPRPMPAEAPVAKQEPPTPRPLSDAEIIALWRKQPAKAEPCMICGKGLTDPASKGRFIGPECFGSSSINLPWIVQAAHEKAA